VRSDEALLEAVVGGDLAAFDDLYARYEVPVFGFVRRMLDDAHEAEDVLHEAFLALLREGRRGKLPSSVKAWLFQAARNASLVRLRGRRRQEAALEKEQSAVAATDAGPEPAFERLELTAALKRAVTRLPEGLSEVFHLRTSGLSYDEVAQVLAVPVGTVKSRMNELVKRLREEMAR